VLDFLKTNNLKATFFVIGSRVLQFPQVLKRAYAEGHQIAIHTWSHLNISATTPEQLIMELKWSIKIINETIGVVPKYFRPPFGEMTANGLKVLSAFKLIPVVWNQDSQDWATYTNKTQSDAAVNAVNRWVPTLKTSNILSLEHDLMPAEVQMALQIGQIAINSGANISPVGTCLHDQNWYSTFVPSNPNAPSQFASQTISDSPAQTGTNSVPNTQSSSESMAILTLLFVTLISVLALF